MTAEQIKPWGILIVGGPADVFRKLRERIENTYNAYVTGHIEAYRSKQPSLPDTLPDDADAVVVLHDMTGHAMDRRAKKLCKDLDRQYICGVRKWTFLEQALDQARVPRLGEEPVFQPVKEEDQEQVSPNKNVVDLGIEQPVVEDVPAEPLSDPYEEDLMTASDVALLLDISVSTVYNMRKDGRLPVSQEIQSETGIVYLFHVDDVDKAAEKVQGRNRGSSVITFAKRLKVSKASVHRWIKAGEIEAEMRGNRYWIAPNQDDKARQLKRRGKKRINSALKKGRDTYKKQRKQTKEETPTEITPPIPVPTGPVDIKAHVRALQDAMRAVGIRRIVVEQDSEDIQI